MKSRGRGSAVSIVLAASVLLPGQAVAQQPGPDSGTAQVSESGAVIWWRLPGAFWAPDEVASGVTAVAASYSHVLALRDGRLVSWGTDDKAPSKGDPLHQIPAEIQGSVTAMAAGSNYSLAISGGRVYGWGSSRDSDPGNSQSAWKSPKDPPPLSGASQVVAGSYLAAALAGSGVVLWGGIANRRCSVPGILQSGVTKISLGKTLLALRSGVVYEWDPTGEGVLGVCKEPVAKYSGATDIAAGTMANLAVVNGGVVTWAGSSREWKVPADALSGVSAVSIGGQLAVAIKNGRAIIWGPEVKKKKPPSTAFDSGVQQVAAANGWMVAVKSLSVPGSVSGIKTTKNKPMVEITWDRPTDTGGGDIDYYEYRIDDGPWRKAYSTKATVKGIPWQTVFQVSVRAVNSQGPGAETSIEATIWQKPKVTKGPADPRLPKCKDSVEYGNFAEPTLGKTCRRDYPALSMWLKKGSKSATVSQFGRDLVYVWRIEGAPREWEVLWTLEEYTRGKYRKIDSDWDSGEYTPKYYYWSFDPWDFGPGQYRKRLKFYVDRVTEYTWVKTGPNTGEYMPSKKLTDSQSSEISIQVTVL